MLSTNLSCFLCLCKGTFGNINWEEPHSILNSAMGICPIIQLSNYTKHPSVLTTPLNIALWHQPKTLHLSNHWLYIYLNLFQDTKWNACCKLHFQQFLIKEGNELWMGQLFSKWIFKTWYIGSWVHWFVVGHKTQVERGHLSSRRESWKEIAYSLNQSP